MKRNLNKILADYYKNIPNPPDPQGISRVLNCVSKGGQFSNEENKTSYIEFVFSQILYVKSNLWFMQIAILVFCLTGILYFDKDLWIVAWVSAMLPLFMLCGMLEVSKSFIDNVVELELVTKYTLRQVMVARILIVGVLSFLLLSIVFVSSGIKMDHFSFLVLVYMSVPFLTTIFLCAFITNRMSDWNSKFMSTAIGVSIAAIAGSFAFYYPQIYKESMRKYWYVMVLFLSAAIIAETLRILNNCNKKLDGLEKRES